MSKMGKRLYPISDEVFDNLVGLVCDTADKVTERDFESRREYLGYIAELSEMLDELRKAKV